MESDKVVTKLAEMSLKDSINPGSNKTEILRHGCAYCAQPATRLCNVCVDMPMFEDEKVAKTFYCNSSCQKADWTNHKKLCKFLTTRKQLYRAGNIAQQIFYIYREHAFDEVIVKVEKEGNTLYLYEGLKHGEKVFVPFPHHLFSCKEDRNAALTNFACTDSLAFMHEIISKLLRGLHSDIDEVFMKIPRTPLETYHVDENGAIVDEEYGHQIVRVKLKTGESYALDMTGAQYGYVETVRPWVSYLKSRRGSISEEGLEFRHFGRELNMIRTTSNGSNLWSVVMRSNLDMTKVMNVAYEVFNRHQDLQEILKLSQLDFDRRTDQLVTFVSSVLKANNDEGKGQGGRFPVTPYDAMIGA